MIYVPTVLATHLASGGPFILADLYQITMPDTSVLRWTSFDADVVWNGFTWSSSCPVLTRGSTRVVIGVEVDTLDMTITPRPMDSVASLPLMAAARAGAFDGARLVLHRAFLAPSGAVIGAVMRFSGRFADVAFGRTTLTVRVNSDAEALAVQLPRNTYNPVCGRTLYAAGCDVSRATFTAASAVVAGSTTRAIVCTLDTAANKWDMGGMVFTSGVLTGVRCSIKSYTGGVLALFSPLAVAPTAGDTFNIYPGCDKTLATCTAKFNNRAKFRGFPLIPIPETAL